MPARQPFTAVCQAAARTRHTGRADLHIHTRHSDGTYTPAEVIDLARRCHLAAVAITDHDTLDALPAARAAARDGLEVVPGVEISAEYRGGELHLLGYFFRADDPPLNAALARLCLLREGRFWEMVERLRGCGVSIDEGELRAEAGTGALGRRRLAEYLVKARRVGSVREAFSRYLHDRGRAVVPKVRLPVAEAIALVRGAGGVAAWAHPSYDGMRQGLPELKQMGLGAVEVEFPANRPGRVREMRRLAAVLGLAVTGGSDCHGPDQPRRAVGSCSVSAEELAVLRQMTG